MSARSTETQNGMCLGVGVINVSVVCRYDDAPMYDVVTVGTTPNKYGIVSCSMLFVFTEL